MGKICLVKLDCIFCGYRFSDFCLAVLILLLSLLLSLLL